MLPVKICGMTRGEDAALAWELGAAAIGLVFHPPSPRHLTVERAAEIRAVLPGEAFCVGVFVDRSVDEMLDVIERVGLDAVQLHGEEPPETAERMPVPVLKAVRPGEGFDPAAWDDYPAAALLVDARHPIRAGGTGERADWAAARALAARRRVILAGGLSVVNLAEAVAAVNPAGLDLCTSLESSPGIKDPHRIKSFGDTILNSNSRPRLLL